MRIDHWPADKVLQLPRHLFGRRYAVSCTQRSVNDIRVWDISELAFPEVAVIWEVSVWCDRAAANVTRLRLALGDQLPTTTAMMDALEPVLPGLGGQGADPRIISMCSFAPFHIVWLKMRLATAGRRLVMEIECSAATSRGVTATVVCSGWCREIPEWMGW